MDDVVSPLSVSVDTAGAACLLTVDGVLDSSTYLQLRDSIVQAALDEPQAVLVDEDQSAPGGSHRPRAGASKVTAPIMRYGFICIRR